MKTMKWLLRREFWENKGSMFWAPLVVASLMVLFVSVSALYGTATGSFNNRVTVTSDGHTTTTVTSMKVETMAPEDKAAMANHIANGYLASAVPLYTMLAAMVFFYCLNALHAERSDRSILFWKSLPVSDVQTVLSKVLTAALVAPLITIAIGTFMSLILLFVLGALFAFHGVNMFPAVLSNSAFYLAPLQVLGMLPVYILWALPTIGWLLMVSAWAKSKVFLWAVGAPLITVIIIKWTDVLLRLNIDINWLMHNVIARCLLGLVPGAWLAMNKVDVNLVVTEAHTPVLSRVFTQSWLTLAGPGVWIGAIAGAAMIFAAMRLRRWKDEG
jgi:ABC-2 type transport system permease protein